MKKYPARLSALSLTLVFGLVQLLVIAAFSEKDPENWKLHSGGELFTILYAVIFSPDAPQNLYIFLHMEVPTFPL